MSKLKTTLKDPDIDYRLLDERGPTTERLQKAREAPIVLAHAKGQIDRAQFSAAQKFYAHWFKSGLCEHYGTIDLTRVFAGGDASAMPKTELQAVHRSLFRHALEVLKAEKSWVLQQVVCREIPFAEVGQAMGYRDREWGLAKAVNAARSGLDILCREWGIQST